jgi:hypothetical protein
MARDWSEWHRPYDDPSSPLSQRLHLVQDHLRTALDRCPEGPIRLISMCAGQGRDVIGTLADHRRRDDVQALLVEWDARNVAFAAKAATDVGVPGVAVVQADAGMSDAYETAAPADIVMACGVFGNISDGDIARTVSLLPSLCAPRATVIWTRHRQAPDRTPTIRHWLTEAGFIDEAFEGPSRLFIGVGVGRLAREPDTFTPGRRLFEFVGYDALLSPGSHA